MSLKTILLLIFTGLYFWAGQYWYTCFAKKVCGDGSSESAMVTPSTPEEEVDYGPLTFKYNDGSAIAGPSSFAAYKDELLSGKKNENKASKTDDNILEITGHYYKGESPEIGMKRAESIRVLLSKDFSTSRMRLSAKDMSAQEVDVNANFAAADFKWVEVEVKKAEVIQLADRAVILFPSGSANPQRDPKINEYLDKLSERIKQTGETVELTGHADNTGTTATNQRLGKQRANSIRNILVRNGVDRNIIKTGTKGEDQPIATNDTEAGRHQNRRVEVKLNKKQ